MNLANDHKFANLNHPDFIFQTTSRVNVAEAQLASYILLLL